MKKRIIILVCFLAVILVLGSIDGIQRIVSEFNDPVEVTENDRYSSYTNSNRTLVEVANNANYYDVVVLQKDESDFYIHRPIEGGFDSKIIIGETFSKLNLLGISYVNNLRDASIVGTNKTYLVYGVGEKANGSVFTICLWYSSAGELISTSYIPDVYASSVIFASNVNSERTILLCGQKNKLPYAAFYNSNFVFQKDWTAGASFDGMSCINAYFLDAASYSGQQETRFVAKMGIITDLLSKPKYETYKLCMFYRFDAAEVSTCDFHEISNNNHITYHVSKYAQQLFLRIDGDKAYMHIEAKQFVNDNRPATSMSFSDNKEYVFNIVTKSNREPYQISVNFLKKNESKENKLYLPKSSAKYEILSSVGAYKYILGSYDEKQGYAVFQWVALSSSFGETPDFGYRTYIKMSLDEYTDKIIPIYPGLVITSKKIYSF